MRAGIAGNWARRRRPRRRGQLGRGGARWVTASAGTSPISRLQSRGLSRTRRSKSQRTPRGSMSSPGCATSVSLCCCSSCGSSGARPSPSTTPSPSFEVQIPEAAVRAHHVPAGAGEWLVPDSGHREVPLAGRRFGGGPLAECPPSVWTSIRSSKGLPRPTCPKGRVITSVRRCLGQAGNVAIAGHRTYH